MIPTSEDIRAKFGDDYAADERTFTMGICLSFATHMAERFRGRRVLETCTGAGFTTIALARAAARVTTIEIEPRHRAQARGNVGKAGLLDRVDFIAGDIMDEALERRLPPVEAAFLDPDWAVTGPDHVFKFVDSNTRPPADRLLKRILQWTGNVALVLPPLVDVRELEGLPPHERERLFLDGKHELFCLYFGELVRAAGETVFSI